MSPIQKIDGKYRKPRLHLDTKIPLIMWLPFLLFIASSILYLILQTLQIQSGPQPELTLIRKHSYHIVAVGDIACGADEANFNNGQGIVDACRQKAVAEAIQSEHADAVLLLGDIQYPVGAMADFNKSFVPYWRSITAPMHIAAGNHDYGDSSQGPSLTGYESTFSTYFPNAVYEKEGKTYYDFNIAGWQFYVLDSNCSYVGGCGEGSPQLDWLTSKVNSNTAVCSIGFWHHPVFTSGQHNTVPDTTYGQGFWRVLQDAHADIVLNGHDHDYERFTPQTIDGVASKDGIREFVVGTGGYSLRSTRQPYASGSEKRIDNSFGYLSLVLSPGHYSWEFKNTIGAILDSGSDSCH